MVYNRLGERRVDQRKRWRRILRCDRTLERDFVPPEEMVTCYQRPNLPNPIGPMPKKTAEKKTADKKDTNKKQNAGKDADDSKVRPFASFGADLSSRGMT
jgi:hypothetical protein